MQHNQLKLLAHVQLNKIQQKKLKTVAVNSVYCLPQSETCCYKLSAKLYLITWVHMYCKQNQISCFTIVLA